MIFQSCPLFSGVVTVRKSERKLVGGYCTGGLDLSALLGSRRDHHPSFLEV